jgi:hypothetical protein
MTYPLVRDLAVDGIPVAVTCRVLGFSKQAYYAWKANPVSCRTCRRGDRVRRPVRPVALPGGVCL